MAFPQRKAPDAVVAIGIKPKEPPALGTPGQAKPTMPAHQEPDQDETQGGGVGPEDVDYSANDLCGSCAHMGDSGDCQKYGFPVEETGHCEAGYAPKDQGGDMQTGEPGQDDMQGGMQGGYGR